VLITADTCVYRRGIQLPVAAEDLDEARRSLRRLAGYNFNTLCFMHGRPIMEDADSRFRAWLAAWPASRHDV